jgi:hypothetical protein
LPPFGSEKSLEPLCVQHHLKSAGSAGCQGDIARQISALPEGASLPGQVSKFFVCLDGRWALAQAGQKPVPEYLATRSERKRGIDRQAQGRQVISICHCFNSPSVSRWYAVESNEVLLLALPLKYFYCQCALVVSHYASISAEAKEISDTPLIALFYL